MSPRIGPIVLANMSLVARLTGDAAIAEILALVSYAVLTLVLQRSPVLRAAAPPPRARAAMLSGGADAPSPAAH